MDGPPIEDGGVASSEGRIVDVAKFDDVRARNSGDVIDLGERALLPGLINAHCHLDYTCLRGKIPRQKFFASWIRQINAAKEKLSLPDYVASIDEGLAEAKRFGTTTMISLEAMPEAVSQIRAPIRVAWFAELIDVRNRQRADEMMEGARRSEPGPGGWGLAPHAPYSASAALFGRCAEIARAKNMLLTTHVAESHEEMLMFRDACGPLFELMKETRRDMKDCGSTTPLAWFVDAIALTKDVHWIIAHLNDLTEDDFALLRKMPDRFHLVHCPRSHAYFGHLPFRYQRLRDMGFDVCLGTDSLASNEDLSLFAEMREFQNRYPGVSAQEILAMVTRNPARSLGRIASLGTIQPHAFADLIAIPFSGGRKNLFEEVIAFKGPPWVMIRGEAPKI